MSVLAALLAVGLLAGLAATLVHHVRTLAGAVGDLGDQVRELTARLEAAEQDSASALARADVAEAVLLDKGVADEEDLEAARARSTADPEDQGRDGELH